MCSRSRSRLQQHLEPGDDGIARTLPFVERLEPVLQLGPLAQGLGEGDPLRSADRERRALDLEPVVAYLRDDVGELSERWLRSS
jgi:hypothetical protein